MSADGAVLVTVAVCTRNRAASLRRTLGSMAGLELPTGLAWEIVVVDNGSEDSTRSTASDFSAELPIRYVHEERMGLARARNRAVGEARGEYVVWTDDDVEVSRRWLGAYVDAFVRHPEAAMFGGAISVRFEQPPPSWVEEGWPLISSVFAERTPPAGFARIDSEYLPFGANYAVRRAEQLDHLYDTRLGRAGQGLAGGEETTLLTRLLEHGYEGRWVPGASLTHVFEPARVTLDRVRGLIRSNAALLAPRPNLVGPEIAGRPLGLWRRWIGEELRWRLLRPVARPAAWMPHFVRASVWRGHMEGGPEAPITAPHDRANEPSR